MFKKMKEKRDESRDAKYYDEKARHALYHEEITKPVVRSMTPADQRDHMLQHAKWLGENPNAIADKAREIKQRDAESIDELMADPDVQILLSKTATEDEKREASARIQAEAMKNL